MLFGKTKLEFKVGVFVFFGLIVLIVFVLSIGDFKDWSSGYHLKFTFNFINGVKIGAPVRYAGVEVGEVKEIKFVSYSGQKTKVELLCWIPKKINIPADSTIWINTLGLLGEKYVEIMPGQDFQKYLSVNESLAGNDPIAMHELIDLGKKITDDFGAIVSKMKNGSGTIGRLIADDTIYNEVEALILDLKKHPWKLFWKTR